MTTLLTTTLATTAAALAPALQESGDEAPLVLDTGTVVGLEVVAEPAPENEEEAPEAVGVIAEVLAHSESGLVRGVVLEDEDGALRRLDWADLLLTAGDDDEVSARYLGTADEFADLPEMERGLLRTRVLSPPGDALPPETGGDDGETGDVEPPPRRYECRVSELGGLEVFGPGELHGYGEVVGAALDCEAGRLTHITVERGDAVHPVPLPALLIRSVYADPDPETDILAVVTRLGANAVSASPAIDAEAGRTVRDADFLEDVHEYFAARIEL